MPIGRDSQPNDTQSQLGQLALRLVEHDVDFLIIGGWSLIALFPKIQYRTNDIDFLIATDEENYDRLADALNAIGVRETRGGIPMKDHATFTGQRLRLREHWRLYAAEGIFDLMVSAAEIESYEALLEHSRTVEIEGIGHTRSRSQHRDGQQANSQQRQGQTRHQNGGRSDGSTLVGGILCAAAARGNCTRRLARQRPRDRRSPCRASRSFGRRIRQDHSKVRQEGEVHRNAMPTALGPQRAVSQRAQIRTAPPEQLILQRRHRGGMPRAA